MEMDSPRSASTLGRQGSRGVCGLSEEEGIATHGASSGPTSSACPGIVGSTSLDVAPAIFADKSHKGVKSSRTSGACRAGLGPLSISIPTISSEADREESPEKRRAQLSPVPQSPSGSFCSERSSFQDCSADIDTRSTRPTVYKSERETGSTRPRARSSLPLKTSISQQIPELDHDRAIEAIAERVCSHVHHVLTTVVREAFESGMAPLEQVVEELRTVSRQSMFARAGDCPNQKQQCHTEPSSSAPSSHEGQLRLPIRRSVDARLSRPQRATSPLRSECRSSACSGSQGTLAKSTPALSSKHGTGSFNSAFSNGHTRESGSPKGWHSRICRRLGPLNPSPSPVANSDFDAKSSVLPTERTSEEKPQHQVGNNEQTLAVFRGGDQCRESRQTFCDRRGSFDEPRCVQSLLMETADQILLDQGLIEAKDRESIRSTIRDTNREQRHGLEASGDVHLDPHTSFQVGIDQDAQVDIVGTPLEQRCTPEPRRTPEPRGTPDRAADELSVARCTRGSESENGDVLSLCSPTPATPTALRRSRVDELLNSLDTSGQFLSLRAELKTDRCFSEVMKASGVMPFNSSRSQEESPTMMHYLALYYQRFIVFFAWLAFVICLWTLWADEREDPELMDPGGRSTSFGLAMDIPLTAGACFGLLSLRTHSGSKELYECRKVFHSHSARGKNAQSWRYKAWIDFACSLVVGLVAVVMRFVAEGITLHSVACAFSSVVLISLTFSMVYFCRASANMVDRYCMQVFRAPPTDQFIFDWNVVQAVLRKASGALEACVFVWQTAALGAIVVGVIDVMRGALTEPAHYASFSSWALVTLDFARVMFCAGAVTDKCIRVPSLISTCSNDVDPKRHYIVQHIYHARAGFYVFDVLIDSALALKIAYMTCVVGFVVATKVHF